jgi:hypothetical protein
MPSPWIGAGESGGYTENRVVISKTTPEPSGSTAIRWKAPPTMEKVPLRESPKRWHSPSGSGTGVEGGATSMTETGSQFPRRTRSFCFSPELRPCGSVVHSLTT